ncbi:kinase-like protein [Fusarium austroafricanum]|uniref:Kinase-like protein n=1 Tax=Fusarium austroafricanum TaxID=2364996 RepID=A0A8H4KWI3_9HYPO|nr:kinase-like protein [Fusarium austroafricanum]
MATALPVVEPHASLLSEVFVGIDFGTRDKGYKIRPVEFGKSIRLINTWPIPSGLPHLVDKVPGAISYKDGCVDTWGHHTGTGEGHFRWLPALLGVDFAAFSQADKTGGPFFPLLRKVNKTAEEVVGDYLREIWKHTRSTIGNYLSHIDTEHNSTVHYVIAVPSLWSPAAEQNMLKAAAAAGFPGKIQLITKSEAAILAGWYETNPSTWLVSRGADDMQDLISYRVKSIEPLDIEECSPWDGSVCGYISLENSFEKYIMTLVGEDHYNGLRLRDQKAMLQQFKYITQSFTAQSERGYSVDLRGIQDNEMEGIVDETIILTSTALRTIFDLTCGQVDSLIDKKIKEIEGGGLQVRAVLLVGEFGSNQYLYSRLIESYSPDNITVLQVDDAASAACKGACAWGLETVIPQTNRRRNLASVEDIGKDPTEPDQPAKHEESQNAMPSSSQALAQFVPEEIAFEALFSQTHIDTPEPFSDTQFEQISTFLRNNGDISWSNVPRLYTVLRLIGQLGLMESFLTQGMTDIWFPFAANTLPLAMPPSIQSNFLQAQSVVLSKGFQLEKGGDRRHTLFSRDEGLPFQVIGRLGRGKHGSVDKVVSTISHHEYARKLFRKTGGLSREKIKTFITELSVLKRVDHRHCIELIGSYSDPKYFALIMEPVGDHNLAEYYQEAKGSRDMLSLMKSFLGCLANALQYLHRLRIRHRDIKPQNIIIKRDCPLITDFGISYNWENLTGGTTTADSGKTLIYAAPEVVRVEARNESADIWSLGCVFLEICTVLKGEEVQNMRERFYERSDSYSFYSNQEAIADWMEQLRGVQTTTDNIMLEWAASMLQPVPSERPTAAMLFNDIAGSSKRLDILFCGPCCLDNDGESTSEGEDDTYLWCDHDTEDR